MFDDKNLQKDDALSKRLERLGGQINPSPALKKAAKTGVPLRSMGIRYTAGMHVRKFSKAVLLYAACVALFLGAILMLPRLFGENGPVASNPTNTTDTSIECNHKYVMLTMGLRPSCTEGTVLAYRCQYCGHSYSKQEPAPGHDFVDGVCTRCGETVMPPDPEDCEHDNDLATCPYCNCDGHEFADNTCTKCGLVCQHEYSDVFPNGICTKCGTECTHNYSEDTCDAVCTLCGKWQGHDYEEIVSTDRICTEGTVTTTACRRCGYSYTETTPAKGHSYENGACTVCGEKQKVIEDTVGSMSLLPGQMYTTYSDLSGDGFYGLDPTTTPVYYNVYTYFEGYTITSIRLPIYRAEKGSVFTVRVVETSGGINTKEIARYTLTADSAISRKWVLFTDLSMKVPEGCTLVFGWMSDDIELAMPTSGYIPGYSYRNDYAGSCGTAPLIMDIYGKKTGVNQPVSGVCEHDLVTNGEAPTCTEGTTVVKACTKCLYSVTSPQPALGHDFVDGQCTRCGSADLTALSGDEIMNLIKADGCPEDKLIYGFDTEVDTATLEKIREFMLDTDAGKVFTIFSTTFYDPTEVSLYGILYESVSETPITKEERQEYYDLVGLSEELQEIFSPHKLTTTEIEEYLMTYLGIAFTEEAKAKLLAPHYYKGEQIGSVTYMEQYDAYYMHNTDSSTNRPNELVKAYTNENGYIMVLADPSRYYDHVTAIVLAPHGDGYRFVMCVEL